MASAMADGRYFADEAVDCFLCMLPAANCQFFLPFNRSLVVWQFQQMEYARESDGLFRGRHISF